jgi:hypothetical protein
MPLSDDLIPAAVWEWSGLIVMYAALVALLAAWCWDWIRRRGRRGRRCPSCGYDMSRSPGLRCSECGHHATRERELWRFNMHGRAACIACGIFILGYAAGVVPRVHSRGWLGAAPTWALIAAIPWSEVKLTSDRWRPPPVFELSQRSLSWFDRWLLAEVCLVGDSKRQPGTAAWFDHYGRWLRSALSHELRAGDMDRPQMIRALRIVSVRLESRPVWPIGVPIYAVPVIDRWVGMESLFAEGAPCLASMNPATAYAASSSSVYDRQPPRQDFQQCLGALSAECGSLPYRWRLARVEIDRTGHMRRIPGPERQVEHPIAVRGKVEDLIAPVTDPRVEAALREALSPSLRVVIGPAGPNARLDFWRSSSLSDETIRALSGMALGLRVELLRNDEVMCALPIWYRVDAQAGRQGEMNPGGLLHIDRGMWRIAVTPSLFQGGRATWTARISGDGAIALRDFTATRYWSGSITIPLKVSVTSD